MTRQRDDLESNACQLEYLNAVLAEGDTAALVAALAAVARAQGMSRAAEDAGLGHLSLYKVLSGNSNPAFATVVSVAAALGYSFSMHAVETGDASKELTPSDAEAVLDSPEDPVARGATPRERHSSITSAVDYFCASPSALRSCGAVSTSV